jgi:hypothetical protein
MFGKQLPGDKDMMRSRYSMDLPTGGDSTRCKRRTILSTAKSQRIPSVGFTQHAGGAHSPSGQQQPQVQVYHASELPFCSCLCVERQVACSVLD